MRYELHDYQRDAALEILKRLRRARRDLLEDGEPSSFALSAITGSGKTVIATAVCWSMRRAQTATTMSSGTRWAWWCTLLGRSMRPVAPSMRYAMDGLAGRWRPGRSR